MTTDFYVYKLFINTRKIYSILSSTLKFTVGSKIIRALEVNSGQKISYVMQFCEINVYQVMIFRLYTVYSKHEMMEISNQTREKPQVLK